MQSFNGNLVAVLSCLFIVIAVKAKLPIRPEPRISAQERLALLPYQIGPYTGRETAAKPDASEIDRFYSNGRSYPIEVAVSSGPFGTHSPEICLPYHGWSLVDHGRRKLESNPEIELQTVVAVSRDTSQHPLACGFYWRGKNAGTENFLADYIQQRWSTITQSMQNSELVTICTSMDDIRQAGAATGRVYQFANDLGPHFNGTPTRLLGRLTRQADGPYARRSRF